MRLRLTIPLLGCLCLASVDATPCRAQAAAEVHPAAPQPAPLSLPIAVHPGDPSDEPVAQKQLVKVSLSTSRPEVTRNHAWGLTADVTNLSKVPLTIANNEVTLVMQPEATRNTQCAAAFTSFLPNTSAGDGSFHGSDPQIVLQPGEHYKFFWSGVDGASDKQRPANCAPNLINRFAETLNFIPGSYTFTVEGKVHAPDGIPYHTFADSVAVKLGIEQLAILLWAGFGSIPGFFVLALRPDAEFDQMKNAVGGKLMTSAILVFLRGLSSAFLIGAVLAVVANRLSDTQFPVKVSVNDVWGALTVGFVFYFIGNKLIDKLKALA